jgi:alpha-glucosidase
MVPLHFLETGIDYEASVYADAPGADWQGNPTAMHIGRKRVNSETVLTLDLAPGGGQAIRFRPLEER